MWVQAKGRHLALPQALYKSEYDETEQKRKTV